MAGLWSDPSGVGDYGAAVRAGDQDAARQLDGTLARVRAARDDTRRESEIARAVAMVRDGAMHERAAMANLDAQQREEAARRLEQAREMARRSHAQDRQRRAPRDEFVVRQEEALRNTQERERRNTERARQVLGATVLVSLFIGIPLVLMYSRTEKIDFNYDDEHGAQTQAEAERKPITVISEEVIVIGGFVLIVGSVCACTLLRNEAAYVVVCLILLGLVVFPLVLVASGTAEITPGSDRGDDIIVQPPSSKPLPSSTTGHDSDTRRAREYSDDGDNSSGLLDMLFLVGWIVIKCMDGSIPCESLCQLAWCICAIPGELCRCICSWCDQCERLPERRLPERQPLVVRHDAPLQRRAAPQRAVPQAVRDRVAAARLAAVEVQQPQPPDGAHYQAISVWEDDIPAPPALARDVSVYECCVCLERPKDVVLSPCAHQCLCGTCARRIAAGPRNARKCPVCRTPIEQIVEIAQVPLPAPSAPPADHPLAEP